ncbi:MULTISPECIES: hypothetical protein [unclassified Pannonibacter]|uniref:hypothetical protein n=1 Tax=unclassified Pannonibacter TaxID=2627228 RepID=UPI0016453518|nr:MULTISPECIES: hypothetical protein [unclassified Pannonibacter]
MSDIDNIADISSAITRYRKRFERHLADAEAAIREILVQGDFDVERLTASNRHVSDVLIHVITQSFILEIEYPIDCPGRILATGRVIVTPFVGNPVVVAFRRDVRQQLGELASEGLTGCLRSIIAWVTRHPVDSGEYRRRLNADLIDIRPIYDGHGADIGGFLENGDPIHGRIRLFQDRDAEIVAIVELFEQTERNPVFVAEHVVNPATSKNAGFFFRIASEGLREYLENGK